MKKVLLLVAAVVTSAVSAQDIKLVKGDFSALKGQKDVNVIFDYSKLTIMKEKKTEAQYVADRSQELNEKNRGNGDIWKKKWDSSKEMIWNPKFLELLNVVLSKEKQDIVFQEGKSDAKYTLLVDAVWIYPGWDVAMMKQPAKVSCNIKLVETANKSNVIAEVTSENAPGDQWGNNFSNESRIGEGFAKTGKSLAKLMLKKGLK
ncbi:MAG: hypothetical protein EOO51_06385 [Flavobacterium sp.]|nr:MAG: hypothetical protein EOO51_06385 [Flavobacterium sp.]